MNIKFKKITITCIIFVCVSTRLLALDASIGSSSITNNICSGATITLSANYSSPYYQWEKETTPNNFAPISGANSSTYAVISTNTGTFRLKVSDNVGFNPPNVWVSPMPITINSAAALSITDNLPTTSELFPTSALYYVSINTTYPPDYTSIDWYFNGTLMQTSALTPSVPIYKPGNYMVVASGCGPERSNVDEIRYETLNANWDAVTYATPTPCSGSCSISGGAFIVGGDIVVQSGGLLTIVGSTLNFDGCYGIIVESGGRLDIGDRSILSAPTQWKGILIEDGGELSVSQGSYICDAVAGIVMQGDVLADVQETTFGRNVLHIGIDDYYGSDSVFVGTDTFGQVVDSAIAITCTGYTAYTGMSIVRGTYIYASSGNSIDRHPVRFYENEVWMTDDPVNRWNCGFLIADDVDSLDVVGNQIKGFFNYGIKIYGGRTLRCFVNTMINFRQAQTSYGYASPPAYPRFGKAMYFKDVEYARILDNEIKYWIYGVQYYENLSSMTSYFNGNLIRDCKYGLVVSTAQDPINYSGSNNVYNNSIDLNIYCNLFKYNDYGIIGSGLLMNQGGGTSAGNRFFDANLGGYLNSVNAIIWYTTSAPAFTYNYYYNSSPSFDDKPDISNNGNLNINGTNTHGASGLYNISPGASINGCTSNLNGPALENKLDTFFDEFVLFPNPANNKLFFKGIKNISGISIFNSEGKVIHNIETDFDNFNCDISMLPVGIYVLLIRIGEEQRPYRFSKI